MPEINPLTNNQIFLKKIAENTGSDYDTGDVSEINPLTIDQIFLKEIAANTAGQSGDITELKGKVADNTSAIEATQDIITDAYDSTHTYNVGDYCIYENALYKCNSASITGSWDSSKWDAVTVAKELGELTDFAMSFKPTGLSFECIGTLIGTSISDVFQDIVNMYYTGTLTDIKYFVGLHSYAGVRMVIGYIYPDKRYGACLAFSFASQAQIQFLNDGIYSTQNI